MAKDILRWHDALPRRRLTLILTDTRTMEGGTLAMPNAMTRLTEEQTLQHAAREALQDSGRMELRDLTVDIDAGCVVLSGCVPTYYARQLAHSLVRQLNGVEIVRDEIDVKDNWQRIPR